MANLIDLFVFFLQTITYLEPFMYFVAVVALLGVIYLIKKIVYR